MRNLSEEVCPRCHKCERWRAAPDYLRDPMVIWDRFPCPPPGTDHARLLIELDWTGQMGRKSGCMALQRVARRCHVDFKDIHSLTLPVPDCVELFQAGVLCGTNCFIAFILAGICVLFCLLLVIVCVRYVRREKQSSSFCSKVLSTKSAEANTHINKDYAQSNDNCRQNGISRRRGLPLEARMTNSGVEARLLQAIQENQLQQYHTDDRCSQCLAVSQQSTLQCRGNRLGYELIYWKDGDFFVQSVPSNDTVSRTSLNRDGSIYGGSLSGSHHYEYIGGHQTDCSCNSVERYSDHSKRYYGRNSVQNVQNESDVYDQGNRNETEHELDTNRCGSASDHYANCRTIDPYSRWKTSRTSVTSIHSRYRERERDLNDLTERSPYQPLGSDKTPYHEPLSDRYFRKGYYSDTCSRPSKNKVLDYDSDQSSKELGLPTERKLKEVCADVQAPNAIKGYKYVFNPSCQDEFTTRQNYMESDIDLQQLQSAISELTGGTDCEQNKTVIGQSSVAKQRRPSSCSSTSVVSDSAASSAHSSRVVTSALPRRNMTDSSMKNVT